MPRDTGLVIIGCCSGLPNPATLQPLLIGVQGPEKLCCKRRFEKEAALKAEKEAALKADKEAALKQRKRLH